MDRPTDTERFFFETNGYLLVEDALSAAQCEELLGVCRRVAARRRRLEAEGAPAHGMTHVRGEDTRLFYLLEEDPALLDLVDLPTIWPYVTALLNPKPHFHASDVILERGEKLGGGMGWHIDGIDDGFRRLGWPLPFLQLKIGYYLTDMQEPGTGNLCLARGSHNARRPPTDADRQRVELFPGAIQVCARAGTAVLFHNAVWHSAGPWTRPGERNMLYYAYEHPWMLASLEPCSYSREFYAGLSAARRELFHPHLFRGLPAASKEPQARLERLAAANRR